MPRRPIYLRVPWQQLADGQTFGWPAKRQVPWLALLTTNNQQVLVRGGPDWTDLLGHVSVSLAPRAFVLLILDCGIIPRSRLDSAPIASAFRERACRPAAPG